MQNTKKEHILAIFFDLEKAYDTTWKFGILSDLYDLDFRGHSVMGFFPIDCSRLELGPISLTGMNRRWVFPKVASPVLFSHENDNIVKSVLKDSEASLFVDDFALCIRAKFLHMHRDICNCVKTVCSVQQWF